MINLGPNLTPGEPLIDIVGHSPERLSAFEVVNPAAPKPLTLKAARFAETPATPELIEAWAVLDEACGLKGLTPADAERVERAWTTIRAMVRYMADNPFVRFTFPDGAVRVSREFTELADGTRVRVKTFYHHHTQHPRNP